MPNFDKDFIYECLKNDLERNNIFDSKIKIFKDKISIDIENKEISGEVSFDFNKSDIDKSICSLINNNIFDLLIRYGLLKYSCFIKSEEHYVISIFSVEKGEGEIIEDISIEDLISEELNFFFYDNLLKVKDNISTFGDFQAVIDALFGISILPKGKNKTYSFIITGLEITKENLMKIKPNNDQVPAIDHITFVDCVTEDKDFISRFFGKSTVINYK